MRTEVIYKYDVDDFERIMHKYFQDEAALKFMTKPRDAFRMECEQREEITEDELLDLLYFQYEINPYIAYEAVSNYREETLAKKEVNL